MKVAVGKKQLAKKLSAIGVTSTYCATGTEKELFAIGAVQEDEVAVPDPFELIKAEPWSHLTIFHDNCYTDAGATIKAVDGNLVYRSGLQIDTLGTARTFQQATSGNRPTYKNNAFGIFGGVEHGTSKTMNAGTGIGFTGGVIFVVVLKCGAANLAQYSTPFQLRNTTGGENRVFDIAAPDAVASKRIRAWRLNNAAQANLSTTGNVWLLTNNTSGSQRLIVNGSVIWSGTPGAAVNGGDLIQLNPISGGSEITIGMVGLMPLSAKPGQSDQQALTVLIKNTFGI